MSISSEVLVESRTMRSQFTGRFDVLDKAGSLSLLPDDTHATTEMVASFYDVDVEAVHSTVRRNREELSVNGMSTISAKEFETVSLTISNQRGGARRIRLFNRKAILNVGMLLTESDVARKVRAYLLSAEELLTEEERHKAWVRSRLNGIEARKSFTDTLKVIHEMSETSQPFSRWASTFTTMMTKATLKIDHAEFKALKAEGGWQRSQRHDRRPAQTHGHG